MTYRQRIALPPDAVVRVELVSIPRAGARVRKLGEEAITSDGRQVPIRFAIPVDPEQVDGDGAYAVTARIEDGDGGLLFISDRRYDVLTGGAPSDVEIVVKPVNRRPGPGASGPR